MGVPKKRIQYRYDAVGNRVGMTAPDGGRFTYGYDVMNRLSQLVNPQGERTTYQYDAAGRRTLTLLANGGRCSTTYDAASRIAGVYNLKSDASVQTSFDYAYDASGNRTGVVEADGTRVTWSYDAASQLTGEHRGGAGGYRNTFTYDAAGNRTLKQEDALRTTYVYDAANQLSYSQAAAGRTTYVYDADGNQQATQEPAGDRTTYVWDYENRMSRALLPSGVRNTMAYEPDGLRVKLEESTGTKKFVWDDQNYLQQTDESDNTQAEYTNEPDYYGNLISHRESAATSFYQFDALGSTRALANASETLLETYNYGAWGTLPGSPTLLTPFLWVGRVGYHWDAEAQNQYVRARYYRPVVARWVSVDPLSRQTLRGNVAYEYGRNAPLIAIDPTGLFASLTPRLDRPPYRFDLLSVSELSNLKLDYAYAWDMVIDVRKVPAGATQIWQLNEFIESGLTSDCEPHYRGEAVYDAIDLPNPLPGFGDLKSKDIQSRRGALAKGKEFCIFVEIANVRVGFNPPGISLDVSNGDIPTPGERAILDLGMVQPSQFSFAYLYYNGNNYEKCIPCASKEVVECLFIPWGAICNENFP